MFPAVYCRIYCRKFLTLSNQKSCYKSKCIRIPIIYLLVGPFVSLASRPSAYTIYPVTRAPLENPDVSIVTGSQVRSRVPSWGPDSTCTLIGGSGTPTVKSDQFYYSKTCLKWPLSKKGFQDRLSLSAGQQYCRTLQGS